MGGRGGQSIAGEGGGSSDVSSAVATYQSTSFDAINNELRFDKPDKFKKIISGLDKASVDKTSDTLYRGLNSDYTKELANKYGIKNTNDLAELNAKLTGKYITDKAYTSTSRDLKTAADFARDKGTGKTIVMQIAGKKKGIEVTKHVKNYRAKKEKEFLLKRGSKIKITRVGLSKTGKIILYTEIV